MKKYNWQHPDWPNFRFDLGALAQLTQQFQSEYQQLLSDISSLDHNDATVLRLDVLTDEGSDTSKIEGINPNRDSLRASIARSLYLPQEGNYQDPHATAIAELISGLRGARNIGLEHKLLWELQSQLVSSQPTLLRNQTRPGYRTFSEDMLIASPSYKQSGKGNVFFVAPPSAQVHGEMQVFIDGFNSSNPKFFPDSDVTNFARIAVSHLWFESIHPFEDGNGRIGRGIADLALCQFLAQDALVSLSSQLQAHKKDYYRELERASQYLVDIDDWVQWFCQRLVDSIDPVRKKIAISKLQKQWWQDNSHLDLNERQKKVIRKLFEYGPDGMEGGLTARKYVSITRASKATATRDLQSLEKVNVLVRSREKGRSTNYRLSVFDSIAGSRAKNGLLTS